jgi:MFS family permease
MNDKLIKRFLVSRVFSSLADQLLVFAIPLIVYSSTHSVALSGFAMFAEWLPRVLSLPIAGSMSDRFGGWRVYGVADFVRATACVSALAVALLVPASQFPVIAILAAICAFFYAQAFIALEATVPLLLSREHMPKAQGILQSVDQSSMIGGPAIGALCVIWIDPIYLIPMAGAMFLLSALLIMSLRKQLDIAFNQVARGPVRSFFSDMKTGFGVVKSEPVLWKLIGLSALVNGSVGLALATGAALTLGKFGQSSSFFGILQVTVGMLTIGSLFMIPRLTRKFSVFKLGIIAYFGIAFGGLLMGLATHFAEFVIGFGLASGLCGLFNVFIRTERLNWIPKEHLGKTISLIVLLNQMSLPVAGLLVSVTAAYFVPQKLFLIVAMLAVVVCLAILSSLRVEVKVVPVIKS